MNDYEVTWQIDSDAETPRKAAAEALAIMRDPFSSAVVFEVKDRKTGETVTIDLEVQEK